MDRPLARSLVAVAAVVLSGVAVQPAAHAFTPSTAQAPTGLRVDGQPAGADATAAVAASAHPHLAWTLHDGARNEVQTGYELQLSGGTTSWDSGQVHSANSIDVTYSGPALKPDTTYTWSVRTWNREGGVSPWSAPVRFDVGPLTLANWAGADWLRLPDGALARGAVTLTKGVARARLYLGAQGLAEPYVNGQRVDPNTVDTPSVTDYATRVVYRDLDVTKLVHQGRNVVGAMMGQGQWSGKPTLIERLDVTYRDGSRAAFSSNGSWVTTAGPITHDDFYYGESYDARAAVPEWSTPGYDASAWTPVTVAQPAVRPVSEAQGASVTALDVTDCCGWSPAALVDGIDFSTDQSEGYHSAVASDADETKWVQVDLGQDEPISSLTLFPAHPTNDTAGDFPGAGFPVRYEVQASDDPTFATATTVVDHTDADQPNPGDTPVDVSASVTARYVRVTATKLNCINGSCTFRLAELGVYGPNPSQRFAVSLQPDTTPAQKVIARIKPKTTTTLANGHVVYDFGQNYVGQLSLRANAPAGTVATVVKGELLDSDGSVSTKNISFSDSDPVRQKDTYTFDGSGAQTYVPHFNYAGFRYAELSGLPAGVTPTVAAVVTHSDVASTGTFDSSNPLLNQIQGALLQTQLNDLQSIPLDCPTREKRGWMGDAGDTDLEAMANLDMQGLYEKWLGDIRTSQNADGSVPSVSPAEGNQAGYFTDPAWGTAYPQVVWDSYTHYGDAQVLRDNYTDIKRWVDYMGTIDNAQHIVTNSPGSWGDDWLSTVSTPHVYFQTLFYLLDSRLLANMADALHKTADAVTYRQLANAIAAGFNATYFDAATDTYGTGTQLSYAMPLVLGIVPAGHEQAVLGKLIDNIQAYDDHVTTGFVGTTFVYQALGLYHRDDVALAIAEQTSYPSFGYMLANGPGTIWEKWVNSSSPDGTSSKPHTGLAGSIGQWFYEQLAGIQPGGTAAYRNFTLAPNVVGDLTHASGSVDTVRGTIASSWQLDGSTLTYHASVPVGTTATVELPLPGGSRSTVKEGGVTIWRGGLAASQDAGLGVGKVVDGALRITAGSGDYTFTITPPAKGFTSLSLTAPGTTSIAAGGSSTVNATLRASATAGGTATIAANAPSGWTATATPASVALTPVTTSTGVAVTLTAPADAVQGSVPVTLTATAPDGTTSSATVSVTVRKTGTLYDFEDGTQGWQAGDNVSGVAAVTSFANGPGTPYEGAQALQASGAAVDATQWRTVRVAPADPIDLSQATHLDLKVDGYGGLPGGTAYQAEVILTSDHADPLVTTADISNDQWNDVSADLSGWAGADDITGITVGFRGVGSTFAWGASFQVDAVTWNAD